jgi:hypothetical protein
LKGDRKLAEAMANSTHALRENFEGYIEQWQERQTSNGKANGDASKNAGVKVNQVEVTDAPKKTKILGYGTSVAVD